MLSDKQVSKFQELYLARFGKEISSDEAREKGAALVRFVKIVMRPMAEEEFRMMKGNLNKQPL